MIRTPRPSAWPWLVGLAALTLPPPVTAASLEITVRAGPHARKLTPVRFEVAEDRLGPEVRSALDSGPVPVRVEAPTPCIAQVERLGGGREARITLILPAEIPAGGEARLRIDLDRPLADRPAWTLAERSPGALELRRGDRAAFRYNAAPVSSPDYGPIQVRDAYIHPAYTPSGALITGDFSPSHPHHRGFFLAYERTKAGNLSPDFWNIHQGSGKIVADGLDRPVVGPVTARFSARHRWEAIDKAGRSSRVALRERWEVEAYDIPGSPYWLFDLTSTQQGADGPLELLPYRYGGMAYRGPEPFVKGTLDVLTSDGKHRRDGDQKPARWVDLTGPVADGSDTYAGAMIADHPSNPRAPSVARIHPTTLPFFCFVPAYSAALTIAADAPTTFRYRVLIHDGHPDAAVDERAWRDFAEPPSVIVSP